MEKTEKELIDEILGKEIKRRRELIPVWIKIFIWIFLFSGTLLPLGLILGSLGTSLSLSLYGLSTNEPITIMGLTISLLFLIKAIVGLGLWTEKEWAVDIAIVDAIVGILICIVVMFFLPFINTGTESLISINFNFRLELLLLVPYLVKMYKIRKEWKEVAKPSS